MLSPAEELGLSGLVLASRVRKAFASAVAGGAGEVMERIREESVRRHLFYMRDGLVETVRVLPCPIVVLPQQRAYIHHVSLTIQNALKRLPELYLSDARVRALLQLPPEEEEWLSACWGYTQRENNPVFGRLDAMIDFTNPMWKDSLRFVEPNMSGIGGLHLVPTSEQIIAAIVAPMLQAQDPTLELEVGHDIRELLMQEVLEHFETLDRPSKRVCFIEPKYAGSGPDEQTALAEYYHERHGLEILHADPSELSLEGGEVCFDGRVVDLGYRDYSVTDLLTLQAQGVDVAPMRTLLLQNRMISSIAADIDQKSCFEVFTDPELSRQYFTAEERQIFRRHILWTRVLSDRRVTLPDGRTEDLLDYARHERELLVLKPNRNFGGEGVMIGPSLSQAEWETALDAALADRCDRWVVQQIAMIPLHEFPVVDANGEMHVEPFYTVMGFAATRYGVSIMGRASQRQVVNVAQRGGMCAILTGHPRARLLGPDPAQRARE